MRAFATSSVASLVGVGVVLAVVAVLPPSAIDRLAGRSAQVAANDAAAGLEARRDALEASLSRLPQPVVVAAARSGRLGAVRARLAAAGGGGGEAAPLVALVDPAEGARLRRSTPVASTIRVRGRELVAWRPVERAWLRGVAPAERGIDVSVVAPGERLPAGGDVVRSAAIGDHEVVAVHEGSALALVWGAHPLVLASLLVGVALAAWTFDRALRGAVRRIERRGARRERELIERHGAQVDALERLLDDAVSEATCGMCLIGADGSVLLWNPAAADLLEVGSERARRGTPAVEALARCGAGAGERVLVPVGDGEGGRSVLLDVISSRTTSGASMHVFHPAEHEVELEQARANFLVTVSHQLRTPVTTLVASIDLLWQGYASAADVREIVDEALAALLGLVDALGRSAMLAQDVIEVHAVDLPVAAVVERVIDRRGPDAPAVEAEVPADLVAHVDAAILEAVLGIVLDNADAYGGGAVHVVGAAPAGRVELAVHDGGPVPDVVDRSLVFEPFARLDPDMRVSGGGLGLGLFRARRLLHACGATIRMDDEGGRTCVRIALPAAAGPRERAVRGVDAAHG
jgi:signal transduction histidine kinase